MRTSLAFLASLALVVLARVTMRGPSQDQETVSASPERRRSISRVERADSACVPSTALEEEVVRNRRETSAAQEAVRHLIDLRAALEEQPLNTGPDLSIESIEAEILAATEAVAAGGRQADFLELDCSEAPCVAVVVVDQPTNDRTNPAILLEQELAADGRYLSSTASITKNGRIMVALGLWDGDVDDVAERRLRQRQSKAVQRTSPRATP